MKQLSRGINFLILKFESEILCKNLQDLQNYVDGDIERPFKK
jgi:hypothetical protein